jgi:phosphopantothenoylcysteine decarboxylase/phosphopantothenate--cysteine ligase
VHIVEPGEGRLAGGDSGPGRLAEAADIMRKVSEVLGSGPLADRTVLVTAGGTREPIDAVRVITNRSSGKQGYAIAEEAAARGARVVLVSTVERALAPGLQSRIEVIPVGTAAEMETAVMAHAAASDIIVMAAAVADFRPKAPAPGKLKKEDGTPDIVLEPTHDFLVELGRSRPPGQVLVGFAAETDDVMVHAQAKLRRKGLDLIVANDISAPGIGFEHDTNQVTILTSDGQVVEVGFALKRDIARAVLDAAVERLSLPPKEHA